MKNLIIQILLIAGLPFITFAQQFQGGLLIGIVGSQVAGDLYSGYNKVGVDVGGYVSLQLDPKYSLQLEMEYIMKGSKHNFDPDFPDEPSYNLNLGYIEMPFLLRLAVNNDISLEAGLGTGVLVQHKELNNDQVMVNVPGFKAIDFSFIAGIGYTFMDRYRVMLRTDNSLGSIRDGVTKGMVRRLGTKWGQYNDILVISLFYKL